MEQQQLWVEPVGKIIVARIRGECTEAILKECQERVLMLVKETHQARVLYDALEMEAPSVELLLLQQKFELETRTVIGQTPLRKAILVPDTRLAYMSRIAFGEFGEGEYRVFYNDLAQAIRWLED
jgi:hypothetical protein